MPPLSDCNVVIVDIMQYYRKMYRVKNKAHLTTNHVFLSPLVLKFSKASNMFTAK